MSLSYKMISVLFMMASFIVSALAGNDNSASGQPNDTNSDNTNGYGNDKYQHNYGRTIRIMDIIITDKITDIMAIVFLSGFLYSTFFFVML